MLVLEDMLEDKMPDSWIQKVTEGDGYNKPRWGLAALGMQAVSNESWQIIQKTPSLCQDLIDLSLVHKGRGHTVPKDHYIRTVTDGQVYPLSHGN